MPSWGLNLRRDLMSTSLLETQAQMQKVRLFLIHICGKEKSVVTIHGILYVKYLLALMNLLIQSNKEFGNLSLQPTIKLSTPFVYNLLKMQINNNWII